MASSLRASPPGQSVPPHLGWCHPSVRVGSEDSWGHPPIVGATPQFVCGRCQEYQNGATRQSGGANWCHPPVRLRQIWPGSPKQCHPSVRAANLVPPPGLEETDASLVPPPNPRGGSGVVAPDLSAQSCSRSPALVASGASPTAADCARWRPGTESFSPEETLLPDPVLTPLA